MKRKQIICLILGLLGAAIIAVIILAGRNATPDNGNQPEPGSPSPSPGITIEPPVVNPSIEPSPGESNNGGDKDDEPDLIIDVTGDPQPSPGNIGGSSGNGSGENKPKEPAKPLEPSTPGSGSDGDYNNGGGTTVEKEPDLYQYKCAEHKCDTPEKHAYIQNLEIEGCSICGSRSCPSFYAVNQWGYTHYTPSKCPKYDVVKDPVYYCQDCGKPTGDGMNNTCARFVNAVNCPNCGEYVQGWTCHGCEITEGDYEN